MSWGDKLIAATSVVAIALAVLIFTLRLQEYTQDLERENQKHELRMQILEIELQQARDSIANPKTK